MLQFGCRPRFIECWLVLLPCREADAIEAPDLSNLIELSTAICNARSYESKETAQQLVDRVLQDKEDGGVTSAELLAILYMHLSEHGKLSFKALYISIQNNLYADTLLKPIDCIVLGARSDSWHQVGWLIIPKLSLYYRHSNYNEGPAVGKCHICISCGSSLEIHLFSRFLNSLRGNASLIWYEQQS